MGDPKNAISRSHSLPIATSVALERGPVPMKFVTVELDDQVLSRPEHVDLVTEDQHVEGGLWKSP
jgi:hypothetical protein